ncbi:hypothetical protein AK830_g5111 [Neonectria ditissima]|uniref:Fucose-specific lectin n=1 Tax=Neonectria ditissima TaxID=78410 RepID=A0A0P7BEW1_9HYPO|nr:hypothetical protein AK830_g5111 [Neonectria ditissima]
MSFSLATITNPLAKNNLLVFRPDSHGALTLDQRPKNHLKSPEDAAPADPEAKAADDTVVLNAIKKPSALAVVEFEKLVSCDRLRIFTSTPSNSVCQINVYGVVNGAKPDERFVCRLSPGFKKLSEHGSKIAHATTLAVCGDGEQGYLFYGVLDANSKVEAWKISLPDESPVPWTLGYRIAAESYLGATWGRLPGSSSADAYLAFQVVETETITGAKATAIAATFHGDKLLVYYFTGPAEKEHGLRLCRTMFTNFSGSGWTSVHLSAPQAETGTQLSVQLDSYKGSPRVIVTYVAAGKSEPASWFDTLAKV